MKNNVKWIGCQMETLDVRILLRNSNSSIEIGCFRAVYVKWYFHDSVQHLRHQRLHGRHLMLTMRRTIAFQYRPNDFPSPIVVVTILNWAQHSHFQRYAIVRVTVLSHLPRLRVNRAKVLLPLIHSNVSTIRTDDLYHGLKMLNIVLVSDEIERIIWNNKNSVLFFIFKWIS